MLTACPLATAQARTSEELAAVVGRRRPILLDVGALAVSAGVRREGLAVAALGGWSSATPAVVVSSLLAT